MISRYGIFCKIIETGSFTKTAELLGYSQSAVSQTIKALEQETGTTLINRRKDGMLLTVDGAAYLPYFQQIYQAEEALSQVWERHADRIMKEVLAVSMELGDAASGQAWEINGQKAQILLTKADV